MNEKKLWITKCACALIVAFTLTPQSAAATAAQPSSPSGRHTDQGKCQEQLPQGKCQETGEQQRQCEGLARALANEWMRSTVVTTNISGIHYENITRASSTAWSDITPKNIHLEPVTQGDGPPFGSCGCFLVIKGSPLVENVSPTGLAASFLSDEEI